MRAFARWIGPEPLAAKVPQIGFLFWVAKLLTTARGEAEEVWPWDPSPAA